MNDILLRYRFRLLFAGTLLAMLALGIPQAGKTLQFGGVLLLILSGLNTLRHSRSQLLLAIGFGTFELVGRLLPGHEKLAAALNNGFGLVAFYLVILFALFRRVTHQRPATSELLYGLCALYLQLGLAFAILFTYLELLLPGSLGDGSGTPLHLDSFVYFSLVTLTTVGYGDIHPLNAPARMLAISEAVIGVFFIALAVSRVINLLQDTEKEL